MFRVAVVVLLSLALAGCLGEPLAPQSGAPPSGQPAVVVGMVDEGLNPYHELFQDPDAQLPTRFLDATAGAPPVPLVLTRTGTYDERVREDQAVWASVEPGRLYWFVGTRLLALSLRESTQAPLLLDDGGHGTHTTSVLRNVSKDAWVVVVQVPFSFVGDGADVVFARIGAGAAWLAEQPWVDIISLSIGFEGNPPLPQWGPLIEATRLAATRGQVVVAGAANSPAPTLASGSNGPPWVITVGGAEESARGWQPNSGTIVDVVSDFTQPTAEREPNDYFSRHGTSFSTPVVAANLAIALLHLRTAADDVAGRTGTDLCRCGGHAVTNEVLRDALNATAIYWLPQDWQPLNYSDDPVELALFVTAPSAPTPWAQMGWGHVGPETWKAMVALLEGGEAPPKPAEARAYMEQQQALREAYWARTGAQ